MITTVLTEVEIAVASLACWTALIAAVTTVAAVPGRPVKPVEPAAPGTRLVIFLADDVQADRCARACGGQTVARLQDAGIMIVRDGECRVPARRTPAAPSLAEVIASFGLPVIAAGGHLDCRACGDRRGTGCELRLRASLPPVEPSRWSDERFGSPPR